MTANNSFPITAKPAASGGRINLVGGDAYSFTGGIQAVNRYVVRQLGSAGLLGRAFFLWDGDHNVSAEGRDAAAKGWTRFFGRSRPRFFAALFRQAIAHPSDLWLCMHLNYALLTLVLAGWRRERVALVIYASEIDDRFTALKRFALRQAGSVIVISRYTQEKVVGAGVDPKRVKLMYIGVPDPRPDWRPGQDRRRSDMVLFVGRMDERYKGQKELLDAMVLLRPALPHLRLVFVGGGQALEYWKQEAQVRGLNGTVEFRGRVPDAELQELYRSATVFAMPSANEGFGLVYTEAMAHGMPCIASNVDAAREVVLDGETGLCVPINDASALAEAIRRIVASPELAALYGRAGRERFAAHFTEEQYRGRLFHTLGEWRNSVACISS